MPKITVDDMLLEAALIGLKQKREKIIQTMARLKSSVDGNAPRAAVRKRLVNGLVITIEPSELG